MGYYVFIGVIVRKIDNNKNSERALTIEGGCSGREASAEGNHGFPSGEANASLYGSNMHENNLPSIDYAFESL